MELKWHQKLLFFVIHFDQCHNLFYGIDQFHAHISCSIFSTIAVLLAYMGLLTKIGIKAFFFLPSLFLFEVLMSNWNLTSKTWLAIIFSAGCCQPGTGRALLQRNIGNHSGQLAGLLECSIQERGRREVIKAILCSAAVTEVAASSLWADVQLLSSGVIIIPSAPVLGTGKETEKRNGKIECLNLGKNGPDPQFKSVYFPYFQYSHIYTSEESNPVGNLQMKLGVMVIFMMTDIFSIICLLTLVHE